MGKSIKSRHYQKKRSQMETLPSVTYLQKWSRMEGVSSTTYLLADGNASKHDIFTEKGQGAKMGLGVP